VLQRAGCALGGKLMRSAATQDKHKDKKDKKEKKEKHKSKD
jgi:hypothetical protein